MSKLSMSVVGVDRFKQRLRSSRARLESALRLAMEEVLPLLEAKAKAILDAEVYTGPGGTSASLHHDKNAEESLYNQFRQMISEVAPTLLEGELANVSDHASFIEDGTTRGVRAVRYMSRAFTENRADVVAIFERHLEGVCG